MAGLCAEADYIFVPEDPPKPDWPERLCEQLSQARILYPPSFPCINQTHTRARLSTSLLRFIFRSALSVHAKSAKISLRQNSVSVPFCAFSFVLIRETVSLSRASSVANRTKERPKVCRFLRARDSFMLLSANQERIRDITFIRYQCVHFI